ncbi:MAG: HAMP domain-containing sensor histidine kinase [Rickettsiaceae bacterium]|nr:HAMP domain-containing sensor histidine kinase [Rickettsiaceae bacterium]
MLIAIEVIILVCISFVKIYIDRKHSTLDRMRDEVQILEKIFLDYIDYSSYVLDQMGDLIKNNYQSNQKIDEILSHYSLNINDKNFFGWRGFYWIDKTGTIRNSNHEHSALVGSNLGFQSNVRLSKMHPGKVFLCQSPNIKKNAIPFLDLAYGVTNDEGEYVGTILLEVETSSLLDDIEMYRRNNLTEFLILDNRMNVITSYPLNSVRISSNGKTITNSSLLQEVSKINFFSQKQKEICYIRIFSGANFLARKLKNKPYLLVVSLDPGHITTNFTKKVAVKSLEISILASFFLIMVLIIYKRETTLRSKAERASNVATKAMIAKSDFLAYAAHEIRSPLGFILTGSEIMSKGLFGPLPEKYKEYMKGIHHNANLILDFINDILNEKNVATGNFVLTEEECDLEEIISKSIKINQTRFHIRKVDIELKIEEKLPKILADPIKMLQTFNNLISNSYKYSLDNTKITVSAYRSGKKIKISVQDQGIGMTQEEIKIALTKYGKVHSNKPGTVIDSFGLGLSIVTMLTKAHDAKLEIDSEVGVGTEVSIIIPERRVINKPLGQ